MSGYTGVKLSNVLTGAYALLREKLFYIYGGLQATGSTVLAGLNAGATTLASLTVSSTIMQTTTGMSMGLYVKTGCSTTETYTFPSTGLYIVSFSVNSDTSTTGSWWVDVLNNVNGGSSVVTIRAPYYTGVNLSINTSTNVLTMSIAYSGGKFSINRMFSY